jgi:glycosyltransferase involved in cell wall biosynthesis
MSSNTIKANKLRVIYITNTSRVDRPYLDPAVRYRCYNPAYDLRKLGLLADVTSIQYFEMSMIDNYDVFVFHKPPLNNTVEAALALIQKRNKLAIADYDDLIFNEKNALQSSLFLTGRATESAAIDIFKRNHEALKFFDYATVSTTCLAKQAIESNPNMTVKVIHNGLNTAWVESAKLYFRARPIAGRIAYFCGTKSHDHDFETIEDVLVQVLQENTKASLHIVGPLTFNKDKFPRSRLYLTSAVPYENLPKFIMQSWVSIAPLDNNLFNYCKSGLKFFEAAAFGVPSVATPIPDMQRFSDANIVLAQTSDEWHEGLNYYLNSQSHQSAIEENYHYVFEKCVSSVQTLRLIDFYNAIQTK